MMFRSSRNLGRWDKIRSHLLAKTLVIFVRPEHVPKTVLTKCLDRMAFTHERLRISMNRKKNRRMWGEKFLPTGRLFLTASHCVMGEPPTYPVLVFLFGQVQGGYPQWCEQPAGVRAEPQGPGVHPGWRVGPAVQRVHQPALEHCVSGAPGQAPLPLGRPTAAALPPAPAGKGPHSVAQHSIASYSID